MFSGIDFHTALAFDAPLGSSRRSIVIPFGTKKLECWGWLTIKYFEDMFSGIDRIPACDGRTDGRPPFCNSIVRAMHMRREVKMFKH